MLRPRAAAVMVLAIAFCACAGEDGPTFAPAPAPTSTAVRPQLVDVQAAIRRGLSALQSYRADIVVTMAGGPDSRVSISTARGLALWTQHFAESEQVFFYNGREGRRVTFSAPLMGQGPPSALVETGFPAGGPGFRQTAHPVRPDPVEHARDLLDLEDGRVDHEVIGGRSAWVVQRSRPGQHPELHVVTIDQQTGLALRVDGLHAGQPQYQLRMENLEVNVGADPSFRVPDGVAVRTINGGSVRTTVEDVRRIAGFAPVLPTWVPPGFTMDELVATVAGASPMPQSPPGISVAWRRGMDLLVLMVLPRAGLSNNPFVREPSVDRTPFRDPEGLLTEPPKFERIRVGSGPFAGIEAERRVGSHLGGGSYLHLSDDNLIVSLGGDISHEDAVRVVESLQAVR